jgi:Spy/CpxP family protein refolding chaperone
MRIRPFGPAPIAFTLALAAMAGAALGCGGTVSAEQAVSASSASTRAPVAQNTHGVVKLVGEALGDVALSPAQRAELEKLAADADARHADARAARHDIAVAVADEVEQDKIDRAALAPKIDALVGAMTAAQPADRVAIQRLHDILTADQRAAFADSLEGRVQARVRGGEARRMGPWKHWADELGLSVDQLSQIRAAAIAAKSTPGENGGGGHDGHGWMHGWQRGAKLLAAFRQDHFVLDEVEPRRDGAGPMGARFLSIAEAVIPILTDQQRMTLAKKLRATADETESTLPFLP